MKAILTRTLTLLGLTSIFAFTGCQDEDFGYTAEQISYKTNFSKTFGDIDPNQSWDLYYSMPRTAKYEAPDAQTRGISEYTEATAEELAQLIQSRPGYFNSNDDKDLTGWYEVQEATIKWMNEKLVEEQNNTSKGEPFALVKPKNEFAIIPIYQGKAGMDWTLHLVDKENKKDYNLWTESQGLIMSDDGETWEQPGTEYGNSQTIGKSHIMGQPIIINSDKIGGEFFLYLDIVKGQGGYADTGTAQRSDQGMMLSLNCPIPTNLDAFTSKSGSLVMLVGCEDANGPSSDWDMNDVVFIIVGYPLIPDLVEYTHKRYMFEDLGNTWDFDFNDVVLDVDQTAYYSAQVKNNEIVYSLNKSKLEQSATLKWLCGTLPVEVTVGDYTFAPISDPTELAKTCDELGTRGTPGIAPEVKRTITGWDPKTNNVSLRVSKTLGDISQLESFDDEPVFTDKFPGWSQDADGNVYGTEFPGPGETPLIICVSQTRDWMPEGQHIPESWWKTGDVFIEHKETPDDPTTPPASVGEKLPWNGDKTVQWGDGLIIDKSEFADAQPGDMIKVAPNNYRLSYNSPSGWVEFTTTANGVHILTAAEIESLQQDGLVITAGNVQITHVELYRPTEMYTFTATASEHGTIQWISPSEESADQKYLEGTTIKVKANPDSGYQFSKWSDGDTNQERTIMLNSDMNLTAQFAFDGCVVTITCNPAEGGTITWNNVANLISSSYDKGVYTLYFNKNIGSNLEITPVPNAGYAYDSWTGDGQCNGDNDIIRHFYNYANALNATVKFKSTGSSSEGGDPDDGGNAGGEEPEGGDPDDGGNTGGDNPDAAPADKTYTLNDFDVYNTGKILPKYFNSATTKIVVTITTTNGGAPSSLTESFTNVSAEKNNDTYTFEFSGDKMSTIKTNGFKVDPWWPCDTFRIENK